MTGQANSEGIGWKRLALITPLIAALIAFAGGWFANSRLERESNADRVVRERELEQKRREHEEDSRIKRYEVASEYIPLLHDENAEVRAVALKAVQDLGVMPVEQSAAGSKSVARLFRSRPPKDTAETRRDAGKLAQDSLLPARDLRLALRDPVSGPDSVAVQTHTSVGRRGAYGLWRDVNGEYWVGGPCAEGQVCASIIY